MRGRHEHRRVDAVRGVAEAGVLPRHPSGVDRIARRRPAVGIDPKSRPDPLAERVAPCGRLRRKVGLEQVAHRDALGREDPAGRHVVEPDLGDVQRIEARPAPLEEHDAEHREVEIVVLGDPVDVLRQAGGTARAVPRPPLRDLLREPLCGEPARDRPVARSPGRLPGSPRAGCSRQACRARTPRRARATPRRSGPPGRRPDAPPPEQRPRGSRPGRRVPPRSEAAAEHRARRAGRARAPSARRVPAPERRHVPVQALRRRQTSVARRRRHPVPPRGPA